MYPFVDLIIQSLGKVWITFTHNWPFLLASIVISVGLKLYIQPEKVSAFIMRYRKAGVVGATAAAVTTPFCSCGTTAVILGMIASTIPWAPIVAFMVASPLTSPEELVYSAGLFGWPFAIAFFVSSILLGLAGGAVAEFFEARGWLVNQARFNLDAAPTASQKPAALAGSAGGSPSCACQAAPRSIPAPRPSLAAESCCASTTAQSSFLSGLVGLEAVGAEPMGAAPMGAETVISTPSACGCGSNPSQAPKATRSEGLTAAEKQPAAESSKTPKVTARQWLAESYQVTKKLLPMFLGFAFIGYVLNGLIPAEWITAVFGGGNVYSVPLAATLGLPLYINTEGSLPLVRALIDGGMSQGAALAFLITGAGTSIGAIGGALTIARWRVIALVVGTLWVGAIILGYAYDLIVILHLV